MHLKDFLIQLKNCDKPAVVDEDCCLTYSELYLRAQQSAEMIGSLVPKHSHIAIFLPNSSNYIISYCAVLLADCVIVPIYFKSTQREIENAIDFCDVSVLITDQEHMERISGAEFTHKLSVTEINTLTVTTLGAEKPYANTVSPQNTCVMLGTSGSTNTPKRVMLSDENLIENALGIIHSLKYNQNERILSVLPLTFASGNTSQLVVSLLLSATIYIYHGPLHPKLLFSAVQTHGITTTTIVPSILKILLSDGKDYSAECKTLRTICFGGGPTDDVTIEKIKHNPLCDKFVHMYGQTEASTRISHLHFSVDAGKTPSVGKPLYNISVSVRKGESDGKMGEICITGPNVMIGYYKEKASPIANGWLATGDIGYIDSQDYIYLMGRKRNIIICSGMNIQAEEVENVLCGHPKVAEALVFGIRDAQHDELPVAEVVLKPSECCTEDELRSYCAEKLSAYKVPVQIRFAAELERTYNGKLARKRSINHE